MFRSTIIALAFGMASAHASAELVNITVQGTVDFNVIGGNQANVPDGAPVTMSFNVDSNVFVNSASFPTRGYNIILNSFSMLVGGQPINILNPQQNNDPAYFVLRNNDPAVDGFFISPGTDLPFPIDVTIPGLTPVHELDFLVTYGNTTTLTSLDILDAVGTYDLTGISVFGWGVGTFGNHGAEYIYDSLTISIVPAPGAAAALIIAGSLGLTRRRRLA